ncbi:golgin candidate 5-like [Amaranthus tricolor]|uniref:golgin candidate 5-like n=1 Tax=Amaranthus tricolor TaxID=29722 RepID=UPI00258A1B5A|nr:golgin candidate 5-like [Amaranthus tricolor]XP_057525837.1 golgin candidate 5-like [Amaranthus tricolor]
MDWWGGKVSLGNLDFSGAVNKLQESVKNIEKNFDSALGLEDKPQSSDEASGPQTSSNSRNALFDPVMALMGRRDEEIVDESEDRESPEDKTIKSGSKEDSQEIPERTHDLSVVEAKKDDAVDTELKSSTEHVFPSEVVLPPEVVEGEVKEQKNHVAPEIVDEMILSDDSSKVTSDTQEPVTSSESKIQDVVGTTESDKELDTEGKVDGVTSECSDSTQNKIQSYEVTPDQIDNDISREASDEVEALESIQELAVDRETNPEHVEDSSDSHAGILIEQSESIGVKAVAESGSPAKSVNKLPDEIPSNSIQEIVSEESNLNASSEESKSSKEDEGDAKDDNHSRLTHVSDCVELEKLKGEMKMMEAALQGAARQAQAKADEIAKLMSENEQLKAVIEELRRKSNDAEIESLREEYHQRVAMLERKVYALTRERDTLRREQNKRSDAAALLKEKDEIITQVMAEGEELSKKQAAQEAQIRKLRAQIRELDEEKKALVTKLQLEENKVESIKKDKAATEKLLQETIEKHQAELAGQKEYYTNALNAAKEAEALAEARANNEARTEVEGRLREAEERETMLVQTLEELRQTLSSQEQQAIMKEDMLRRDIEDLQKRYQASERRCEELVSQLPESTRPLLRQIEAMQETSARKAEAWAAVERTLQSRLQEAEAKAASAEERERSINERLSQTLSRINVLEAQISCLRTEQTQLNRSLEKERQRAAENRQEYLAAKEIADTHEGRVNQLEEEIKQLKRKHKNDLQESLTHRELLQQELDQEKAAKLELQKAAHIQSSSLSDQSLSTKNKSTLENGQLTRKLSSASSVGNMEESFFLQASLESSSSLLERRNSGEATMSPYYLKSMNPSAFEAALRQKEGELASYMSRLASLESIRDSLAEELVKMTEQCEKLRSEASMLPGIRAELEALRRRHTAALELMGERDEELEELRADIVDLKEMYREQVNLLVNKIQTLS